MSFVYVATRPATAHAGMLYFDQKAKTFEVYTGKCWMVLESRSEVERLRRRVDDLQTENARLADRVDELERITPS